MAKITTNGNKLTEKFNATGRELENMLKASNFLLHKLSEEFRVVDDMLVECEPIYKENRLPIIMRVFFQLIKLNVFKIADLSKKDISLVISLFTEFLEGAYKNLKKDESELKKVTKTKSKINRKSKLKPKQKRK